MRRRFFGTPDPPAADLPDEIVFAADLALKDGYAGAYIENLMRVAAPRGGKAEIFDDAREFLNRLIGVIGMEQFHPFDLQVKNAVSGPVIFVPSVPGELVRVSGNEDSALSMDPLHEFPCRENPDHALLQTEYQEFPLHLAFIAGREDFLAVNQDESMGIGDAPQIVEFIIGPAHPVFGEGQAVKADLHCPADKVLGVDKRTIGVIPGVQMEIKNHDREPVGRT